MKDDIKTSKISNQKISKSQTRSKSKVFSVDSKSKGWAQGFMTVIPALCEAGVGRSRGQEFKTSLDKMMNSFFTKNTKVNQVW